MKFSCGRTWEQVRRDNSLWHRKFLWFPTVIGTTDGYLECRWLCTVWRRRRCISGYGELHAMVASTWVSQYTENDEEATNYDRDEFLKGN